jgi:type II secretory pathway pseudopilin PulG
MFESHPPKNFASPRARGFTILEILIATAILTLGLVGILAIFPIAIDNGKKVMERSTAVTIAKSVAEAIRSGIRNQKRTVYGGEETYTYFIFNHDGVKDPIPRDRSQERAEGDYYILLPQFKAGGRGIDGNSDGERRERAVADSYEFVYPEVDQPKNGGGDPYRAHNDAHDAPGGNGILVKDVYKVGNLLPNEENTQKLPDDYILSDQVWEMYKQFSFAFSIRTSKFDTNVSPVSAARVYKPGNNLYHVRVMIFRSFFPYSEEKIRAEGKGPEPVFELDFEVVK